ncbi:MAG TPA: thioesterase family protein [Stellaceae bacterium]|nr:thioesterase family protein [Stellaceae bacterium]
MGGFVETYRGGVAAWECDAFGHLNIAFYGERFDDAARDLLERRAPGGRWRTLALDTSYHREFRAGEGFIIRSAVLDSSPQAIRIAHEAVAGGAATRTTLAEQVVLPLAPADGAVPAADALEWQRFPPLQWPAGAGPIPSGRDRVKPDETEAGRLRLSSCLHRFSNACLHVIEAVGMTHAYRQDAGRGFATFETRLAIDDPAAGAGDGLVVASEVVAVGRSSLAMLHRLAASRDGRALARFYQAGVHFDLAARRSAPWPDSLRDKARALVAAAR